MIVKVIFGVLLVSIFIGWLAWRFCKHNERMEQDIQYRRRWLYVFSGLFLLPVIILSIDVVRERSPVSHLLGVPIDLGIALFFFRSARRIESSSKADTPKKADQ